MNTTISISQWIAPDRSHKRRSGRKESKPKMNNIQIQLYTQTHTPSRQSKNSWTSQTSFYRLTITLKQRTIGSRGGLAVTL